MDNTSLSAELKVGARIKVTDTAGPRLANKRGIVIGSGKYRDSVRITLDGSKTSMTLHKKYLNFEEAS